MRPAEALATRVRSVLTAGPPLCGRALGRRTARGRSEPDTVIALAIAALERADTAEIRRFALRQLWKGPLAFVREAREPTEGCLSLSFMTRWRMAGRLGNWCARVAA